MLAKTTSLFALAACVLFAGSSCSNENAEEIFTVQHHLTFAGGLSNSASFGISVAMDAQTLVVGDHFAAFPAFGPNPIANRGQVQVFNRSGNAWQPLQVLTRGAKTASEQHFGQSVVLRGNTLLIGAHRDQVVSGGGVLGTGDTGAVYHYTRSGPGSSFTLANRIADPALTPADHFGRFIATNGSLLAIAKGDRFNDPQSCPVYVYSMQGTTVRFLYQFQATDNEACLDMAMTDSGVLVVTPEDVNATDVGTQQRGFRLSQSAATPYSLQFLGCCYEEVEARGESVAFLDRDDGGLVFQGLLGPTAITGVSSNRLAVPGTLNGLFFEGTHALVSHVNGNQAEVLRFTPDGADLGSAGSMRVPEAESLPSLTTFGDAMASTGLSVAVGNWAAGVMMDNGRVHFIDFPSFHGSVAVTTESFSSYCAHLKLTNRGTVPMTSWQVLVDPRGSVSSSQNAAFTAQGNLVRISNNQSFNATVPAGAVNYDPQVTFCATRPSSDALSAGVPLVVSTTGTAVNPLRFPFETSTMGWTHFDASGRSTNTSTSQHFEGTHSLALNINGTGNPRVFLAPVSPSPSTGTTVTFHVFIPTNAPVTAVQPFIASANFVWSSTFNSITAAMKGSWRTYTVTFAAGSQTPAAELGVKFYLSASYNGPVFIDAVNW